MDLLKSMCSLTCSILAIVFGFLWLFDDGGFLCFILMAACFIGAFKSLSSVSPETQKQMVEYEKHKEYQKLHGGYKCPSCGMMAGHKINAVSKGASLGVFGIASDKLGKTYKCENCKYIW